MKINLWSEINLDEFAKELESCACMDFYETAKSIKEIERSCKTKESYDILNRVIKAFTRYNLETILDNIN